MSRLHSNTEEPLEGSSSQLSPITDLSSEVDLLDIPSPNEDTALNIDSTASEQPSAPTNAPTNAPNEPTIANSEEDSDSETESSTAYNTITMTSDTDVATAVYAVITQPPTLTSGKITPKALMLFEQHCLDYFVNAKGGVSEELKVPHILSSFKDIEILDWIASD